MVSWIFIVAVAVANPLSAGVDSPRLGYRVEWGHVPGAVVYELHRPKSAHGDRDTLIYRGPRRGLHFYQSTPPSFRTRVCTLGGCSPFSKTQLSVQGDPEEATPTPVTSSLIVPTRARDGQRIARRNQPKGSRLVGLVEMSIGASVYACNSPNGTLGLSFEVKLPGLKKTIITSHRLIENGDGSWSWFGQDVTGRTRLNLNAGDCSSRPFGSVKTTKGSFWIRPVEESPWYAVYRQKY